MSYYKLNQNFIDSSQILKNYNFKRNNEKSPLISTPNFSQRLTDNPNYVGEDNEKVILFQKHQRINARWVNLDIFDIELIGKFIEEWKTTLAQLHKFANEQKEEMNAVKPTQRAFRVTLLIMFEIYKVNPQLSQPDIVVSGDGGVDIEWELESEFISVQIKREENGTDKIYFEQDDEYGSTEVTKQNLERFLA